MSTLSGGPRPDDFDDEDVLTAVLFKEATQFWVTDDVPSDGEGKDGDVVFVLKEEELGAGGGGSAELPGIGGWAEITDVSGSPKRYSYNDGDTDWVAFEWTGDGDLMSSGGLVETLVVGAGEQVWEGGAGGGTAVQAITWLNGSSPHPIEVSVRGGTRNSSFNNVYGFPARAALSTGCCLPPTGGTNSSVSNQGGGGGLGAGNGPEGGPGLVSTIKDGNAIEYGRGGDGNGGPQNGQPVLPNTGCGAHKASPTAHSNGVVIVRVPAAQAEKVPSGSWVTRSNYFAVVENGVVTETYTEHHYGNGAVTPLPQTDLIPCDANVTEGYAYENGEFVAPPAPEIPAAQQEILDRINELQKDLEELTK